MSEPLRRFRIFRRNNQHARALSNPLHQGLHPAHFFSTFRLVGLREKNDHFGTALVSKHQFPLKPSHVQSGAWLRNEHLVEIRGKDLRLHTLSGVFAHKSVPTGKNTLDDSFVVPLGNGDFHAIAARRAHVGGLDERRCMFATVLQSALELDKGISAIELYHYTLHYRALSRA